VNPPAKILAVTLLVLTTQAGCPGNRMFCLRHACCTPCEAPDACGVCGLGQQNVAKYAPPYESEKMRSLLLPPVTVERLDGLCR
jgi:hypothetical protein